MQVGQWLVTLLDMQTNNNNNNADAVHSAACKAYDHALADSLAAANQVAHARAILTTLEDIDADLLHVMREAFRARETAAWAVMVEEERRQVEPEPEPVRVRLIECYESSEGVIHIHADGCRDIGRWERASFDGARVGTSFTAGETVAEATLSMSADFNSDFAGDEGMSPMDYVTDGKGYPINVLPCAVKVIQAHM